MPKIRVALVDDHTIVREGLRALLHELERFEVVAEAGTGVAAMDLVDREDIEVFLMDIAMPDLNGLNVTRRLLERRPDARVMILSMYATPNYVQRAMEYGAKGYLLKNMAPEELERAICKVAAGGTYVSPSIAFLPGSDSPVPDAGLLSQLTARQQEILIALVDGMSTREIAHALSISAKTVETHRSQLMQKLGIYDVPGLVKFAIRNKLVTVE